MSLHIYIICRWYVSRNRYINMIKYAYLCLHPVETITTAKLKETETVPPSHAKSGRRAAAQMAPCTPLSSDHGHQILPGTATDPCCLCERLPESLNMSKIHPCSPIFSRIFPSNSSQRTLRPFHPSPRWRRAFPAPTFPGPAGWPSRRPASSCCLRVLEDMARHVRSHK